jgi:hypothetical protein
VSSITDGDLRRSAVEAFGCPFRYQQIHLNGVDDTGDESMRGRAFHAAAWIYILRLSAKQLTSDHEEAQLALRNGIATTGCPDQLIVPVEKLWNRWAPTFELDLDAFLQAEEIVRRGRRTFRPDLAYCRPGEVELIDFKTYYKGLTEVQARAELQPRWYLVEAKAAWPGFAHYRFTFDFVRLGYKVSIVYTPDEIDAMEAGVQGSIDAVVDAEARGEFPALPGSHCTLCRLKCPVVDDPARTPVRVTTEQEALDVFGQILSLEQRRKTLVKALGAYVKVEGPVLLRGQVYRHAPSDQVRYPLDKVVAALDGTNLLPTLTISQSSLKSVWKKPDAMPDSLKDAAITRRGWRFGHKRGGELDLDDAAGLTDALGDDDDNGD